MKALREALEHCEHVLALRPYPSMSDKMMLRHVQLALHTNGWHEIAKDGKPTKAGRYWVFADRCHCFARVYDPERGADFDENISHWIELPENPTTT